MKILIVEDSAPMRRLIRGIAAAPGDVVEELEDGAAALIAYAEFLPDWVLMDVMMRGVDGLTATRRIVAEYPEAKVLIVTDYDGEELRAASEKAGARGVVNKENLLDLSRILRAPVN